MSKKLISMLAALALATAGLSGCGKSDVDDGFTKVEMWSGDSHAKAVMNEIVNEFNETVGKENKVKFVWTLKEGSNDELKIALQQGKEPDLFGCYSLKEMAENGYIACLDDIPEIAETIAKNNEVRDEGANVYEGKMYLAAVSSQVYGLAYNKDLFKEAGIVDENGEAKPPETLAELREDAKILTDASKKQYGIAFPGKWGAFFDFELGYPSVSVTGSNGYDYEKGEYDYSLMAPMLQLAIDLKEDGSIYPGMEGLDNDPARARFAEGNIGMKFAVSWDVGVWNDQFKAKCDWGIAPFPGADDGTTYYQPKNASWTTCISARNLETKRDAIALVFNYLYSDEMLSKYYAEGVYLPWRSDIVENTTIENAKVGWEDFGEIIKISKKMPQRKSTDTSGYDSMATEFMAKVWTGEMSVNDFVAERTKISNEGIARWNELHPEKVDTQPDPVKGYFEEMKRK